MGWVMWNAMRLAAGLGFAIATTTLVLFVWRMFDVGLAWVGFVVIGLASLLVFFSVKNRRTDIDIRR